MDEAVIVPYNTPARGDADGKIQNDVFTISTVPVDMHLCKSPELKKCK
jgi:hypothetical protein